MNKATWQRAKEIFDEARGLADEIRSEFIDNACENDAELRAEVEKLLTSYDSEFLEESALGPADALIEPQLASGQTIGRYRIKELIGTGGMGQVFLADDTELDRKVAFKVIHCEVATDAERVRRFIQEARSASALNHPNILTIHEIGSFDDARFIVSEYIDGETLRERMRRGLGTSDSVEIACQIAAALKAAHAAGIVHRDIKPENVMIREDGLVKVLDFGLAKLTESDDRPIDAAAIPASPFHTSPGLVMGTVAYMSPEQASGKPVDARTDLWSLGVVLHEMLTGSSPFEGESMTELLTSILRTDRTPLTTDKLPPEMLPICQKALAKDKDSRYRSAHDLLKDLEGEKKRMEYAIQPTPFISAVSTDDLKTQLIRPRPTLSAEYIVTSVKRHKFASLAALLGVAALGIGFSVYNFNGAPKSIGEPNGVLPAIDTKTTTADLKMSRFPSSGKMAQVAISPDGKYIGYVVSDGPEKNALRLRTRGTSTDVQIVPAPTEGGFEDISFSPDSSQIYYLHSIPAPFDPLYKVSISGGAPQKIVNDADSGASISPDGKLISFLRGSNPGMAVDVIVANNDGQNERILIHSPEEGPWTYVRTASPWSHDGKSLVGWTLFEDNEGSYFRFVTIAVADGSVRVRDEKWSDISGAVFMPDGSFVLVGKPFPAERTAPAQLWLISPNAAPKSITSDVAGFSRISATRKGDVLVTIQDRNLRDLWNVRASDANRPTRLTNSGDVDHGGIDWTDDGRILFSSNIGGNRDIWIMNADGSGRKQLTRNHGTNMSPSMSADGRYIVFLSDTHEWDTHVFRMDADGANPIQLTHGRSERFPRISPDGKWVYFTQEPGPGSPSRLCKVSIDGGEPIVLATGEGRIILHDLSSNGSLAYEDNPPGDNTNRRVRITAPSDHAVRETLQFDAATTPGLMQWSADGRYVTFQERKRNANFDVIGGMSTSGKRLAKPLVTFTYPISNGSFAWSKDGKRLAYAQGATTSDAIMITRRGD